jgi:cell fate regulator YaaT (PSP1 superfamily)
VGKVVIAPGQVVVNELGREELKPILRLATTADIMRADALRTRAEELLPEARRLGQELGFPARIDTADFTLDGRRLTFSFTSEERLDYREFIREASRRFDARVDMRQMGARDRAKAAGGYGICGRELCCSSWLTTFPSISIRMAKEQELPLNPQKISGLCGRLLCCLSYEEEGYKEMRKTLPKIGQRCSTPTGEGRVIGVNILQRQVTLVVEGQRVEVTDRDLGTVVRWDTSSRSATPPPSISRAEAIESGLIEATDEDLRAAELAAAPRDWITEVAPSRPDPGPGLGRLPGGGPRRQAPNRPRQGTQPEQAPREGGQSQRGRGRRPAGDRTGQAEVPQGRAFQRSQPPVERSQTTPPGEGSERSRRGRRRRGRDRGTDGPAAQSEG